jgi:DNA-binding phage protein
MKDDRTSRKMMTQKTTISHDEAMIRRIRKDPEFAIEYLRSAVEDTDDPRVRLIALRHVARSVAKARRS